MALLWPCYTLERFGAVDQALAWLDRELGGDRVASRVDGYGAKYVRIAAMELAGLREDEGLLEKYRHFPGDRLSFVDIDPSFPDPAPNRVVVMEDFLGDRTTDLRDWILNGTDPQVTAVLLLDEGDGEVGPWVLLDSFANQEDLARHRNVFVYSRGLLVPTEEADAVFERLEQQHLGNKWLPDAPHDVYRFAGETPWCETYPFNGSENLEFQIGTQTEQVEERRFFRKSDGAELRSLATGWTLWGSTNGGTSATGDPDEELRASFISAPDDFETKEVSVERHVPILEARQVLIPVRRDSWEDYHSVVNPGRSAITPAREITDVLRLVSRPQTFDLFAPDGRRATIALESEDYYHTYQRLAYIRRDLLDSYLAQTSHSLIWAVWGERGVAAPSLSNHLPVADIDPTYKVFQSIHRYVPLTAVGECRSCTSPL